jgi:hypothetical protein
MLDVPRRLHAHLTSLLTLLVLAATLPAQDFLDRLDEVLTLSLADDRLRTRLSGTLDLEWYHFDGPAPGLLFTPRDSLFSPRLTLFLDARLGAHAYAFAQARVDRGFDPADRDAQLRLDEYALRITPWDDGRFQFQLGRFATVVGNWAPRHGSWDNPFITAPVPCENLTGIWDSAAVDSPRLLFSWSHVPDGRGGFSAMNMRTKTCGSPHARSRTSSPHGHLPARYFCGMKSTTSASSSTGLRIATNAV